MVDEGFEAELEKIARELLTDAPVRLKESILYSLLGPGKRLRPRIVLAVARVLGLPSDIGARLAVVVEMVHAYTLVHDDLPAMDNDDFRRGRPTNHKVYGEATALLAGDSLALLAVDALLPLAGRLPPERFSALLGCLLDVAGARGVIAGQALESTIQRTGPVEDLWEIFRLKTGALFRAAIELPAIAAGSTNPRNLGAFGEAFGIAFQIADDLEDDFEAARSTPHHVAAYLNPEVARSEALALLESVEARLGSGGSEILSAVSPFTSELRFKLQKPVGNS